jgi:hypothetical protein
MKQAILLHIITQMLRWVELDKFLLTNHILSLSCGKMDIHLSRAKDQHFAPMTTVHATCPNLFQ